MLMRMNSLAYLQRQVAWVLKNITESKINPRLLGLTSFRDGVLPEVLSVPCHNQQIPMIQFAFDLQRMILVMAQQKSATLS